MKSIEELTSFYYDKLYPTIEKFENRRKKLKKQLIFLFGIVVWNAIALYFIFFYNSVNSLDAIAFFIFVIGIIGSFLYKYLKRDYRTEFKEEVIKPLIKELDDNLNYSANLHISKDTFNNSLLFNRPDKFSGNDFIIGQLDKTKIQFSDVHAQKEYKNAKGNKKYSTIFQGLFIIADFNKNFYGTTFVLPDVAQNSFGNLLGHWLQSKNYSRGELVKLDSLEFEREFVVYSDDQIEARYILTPTFMERILDFKKKSEHNISISFKDNHLHMAIDYKKDLFEPTMFTSLLDEKLTKEYINSLYLAVSLVEDLKLNERIWSKREN